MAEIVFSPEAVSDLREIKSYIREELANEQGAVNSIARIMKRIRLLSALPLSGAPLSSVADIETDYRFAVCGGYTVFYRYEGDTVYVVRVLYGRRDFMRVLFDPQ